MNASVAREKLYIPNLTMAIENTRNVLKKSIFFHFHKPYYLVSINPIFDGLAFCIKFIIFCI